MTELKERPREGEAWRPLPLELQSHPYPGRLITFEGVDGAGKSCLVKALARYLDARGQPHIVTKTPSEDVRRMWTWRAWSDGSRNVPRSALNGYGLNIIALGDRLVYQGLVVEPALRAGKWVLCEKYVLTSVAYESDPVHEELAGMLIRPDLGIVVDVPPEEALRRLRDRPEEDEHPDDAAEILQLRDRLVALARRNEHVVVSTAASPVERSIEQLRPYIDRLLHEAESGTAIGGQDTAG